MKPILFNTEMVQAILEGRKTVTRRLIKPAPAGDGTAPKPLKTRPGYWNAWGTILYISSRIKSGIFFMSERHGHSFRALIVGSITTECAGMRQRHTRTKRLYQKDALYIRKITQSGSAYAGTHQYICPSKPPGYSCE